MWAENTNTEYNLMWIPSITYVTSYSWTQLYQVHQPYTDVLYSALALSLNSPDPNYLQLFLWVEEITANLPSPPGICVSEVYVQCDWRRLATRLLVRNHNCKSPQSTCWVAGSNCTTLNATLVSMRHAGSPARSLPCTAHNARTSTSRTPTQ